MGTDEEEENIIENFWWSRSRTFKPVPATNKKYQLRNTAYDQSKRIKSINCYGSLSEHFTSVAEPVGAGTFGWSQSWYKGPAPAPP